MLKKPPVLLIALSLSFLASSVFAQQDTVTVTYSEEPADSSDFSLKEKYRYWTRANVEEKSMFKIGLSNIGWGGYYGPAIGYRFAYERKIGIPLSFLIQYRHQTSGWEGSQEFGADLGIRYYYLLPELVKKGKRANNLSSIYLSLQGNNSWSSFRDQYIQNGSIFYSDRKVTNTHSLSLLQGIQLRLGRYGYLDANLGASFNLTNQKIPTAETIAFDGNFSIGIAF